MNKKCTPIWVLVFLCSCMNAFAAENFWKLFPGASAPSRLPRTVHPDISSIFTLQQGALYAFLDKVGRDPDKALEILLPTPGNTMRSFLIWETPMMEEGLAAKFPGIRTYTATAQDDPMVSAKLDKGPFGFRAMIYDGSNSYLIDPYSDDPDGYYLVFYQRDLTDPARLDGCFVDSSLNTPPGIPGSPVNIASGNVVAARQNGSLRRIYRLAVSCTGEYALAVSGMSPTKPLVMSKIISTVNRINGIYEREFSVSFSLVSGNDDIIYTDPVSDPYQCNSNLSCLINEVQANISSTIGDNAYDIGHIFCTAGGGLAALWATCNNGSKAMGTSTSGGPDDFGVPLHEIGHQFGANHTFSANSGGCNGNGAESNAYEPGSGSSIMSYGGLCAPNNVAPGSDNYFHVASLIEVHNFLTTQGSGCGSTETGINPVSIPDLVDSYYIPANTPFELRAPVASAVQVNAGLSYSWEQFDLGNFGGTEFQNGNATSGPIMRSYPPDTSRVRQFPVVHILDGSYSAVGERLPLNNRTIRFKLTARSVYQGWGTFAIIDSVIRLQVANAGLFRVTEPGADEIWEPGAKQIISWDIGNTDQAPVNCHAVNIYLSLNNGATFPILMVANAPNTGSYEVTVPNIFTTEGRVKVQGLANVFYDVGKGKLQINGNNGLDARSGQEAIDIYPNPATDLIHIRTQDHNTPLKVNLFNTIGKLVWTGTTREQVSIPAGHLARGLYIIQISNPETGTQATHEVLLQ